MIRVRWVRKQPKLNFFDERMDMVITVLLLKILN